MKTRVVWWPRAAMNWYVIVVEIRACRPERAAPDVCTGARRAGRTANVAPETAKASLNDTVSGPKQDCLNLHRSCRAKSSQWIVDCEDVKLRLKTFAYNVISQTKILAEFWWIVSVYPLQIAYPRNISTLESSFFRALQKWMDILIFEQKTFFRKIFF